MITVTYDKPSSDTDCKVRSIRRLVEAFSGDRAALDVALDRVYIRGEWIKGQLTAYDYDLQSWVIIEA